MKIFLVLSFYLMVLGFVSPTVLNETSLLLRPKATNFQNQSQKPFLMRPQEKGKTKTGRIIFLKNLFELKCIKKTLEDMRKTNRLRYRQSHAYPHTYTRNKPLGVPLTNRLQNQYLKFKKMMLNPSHVKSLNRANSVNSQTIFMPNVRKFIKDDLSKFLENENPNLSHALRKVLSNHKLRNFNVQEQNLKFLQQSSSESKNNENLSRKNSRDFTEDENNSRAVFSGSFPKNYYQLQKPNNVYSTFLKGPVASSQLQRKRIRPTELFEEKMPDQKNSKEFKNQFHEQNYLGSSLLFKEEGEKLKHPGTNIDIKNQNLKILTEPMNLLTKKGKEIFYDLPFRNSNRGPASSKLEITLDNDFSDPKKIKAESKFIVNPQGQKEPLKITVPYLSEVIKNAERSTKTIGNSKTETNFTPTITAENVENVTQSPSSVLKTKYFPENETKNLEPTTRVYELPVFNFPEDNLDVSNVLFKDQEPNIPTTLPLYPTENEIKNFITLEETVNESTSGILYTSSKTQTTAFVSSNFLHTSPNTTTENPGVTEINSSEEGVANLNIKNLTDNPLTVDLSKNKKDQETLGKNSRKMHFEQEILTTAVPNQVSQQGSSEQRRSDILIDDPDDYFLQESAFSSKYLKQLKQNNLINTATDAIIQLIPFVINDLRENRISSEDIPILTNAFGDYWPTVLTLTNSTNLDMLPLLKMKNENDLKNYLETFFPEKSENSFVIASKEKENEKDSGYYYSDDYTILSKEEQEYWMNEEPFKFKSNFKV